MVHLGRYLYRGAIQARDIFGCENGQVTYRFRHSETKKMRLRTVSGATFVRLADSSIRLKPRSRNHRSPFLNLSQPNFLQPIGSRSCGLSAGAGKLLFNVGIFQRNIQRFV